MDAYTFAMQQRTFDVHGYAVNPSSMSNQTPIVGSLSQAHENGYLAVDAMRPSRALQKATKRKRKGKGDASVVDGDDAYMGPWAAYEVEQSKQIEVDDAEDGAEEWRAEKKRREEAQETAREAMKTAREEKTIFHGEYCKVNDGGGLCFRQGTARLRGSNIYAHPDRLGCKAQSIRGQYTTKFISARQVHTYLGERCYWPGLTSDWPQQRCFLHQALPDFWSFAFICQS
jgi:hypothetical protein